MKENRKIVLRIIDAAEMICNYKSKESFIQGFKLGVELSNKLQNRKDHSFEKENLNYRDRSQVGFLFRNFALIENKTVEQNLEIVAKKNRTNYSIMDVLEKVGLQDKLNNKIYTLSGGEQQRIALARLFVKKCNIILADEPTGSLDPKNAQIVMRNLLDLNQLGKTVILVTHDEKIKKMAREVIELS